MRWRKVKGETRFSLVLVTNDKASGPMGGGDE